MNKRFIWTPKSMWQMVVGTTWSRTKLIACLISYEKCVKRENYSNKVCGCDLDHFHILQLVPIRFTPKKPLGWLIQIYDETFATTKMDWKSELLDLVMVVRNACLFDFLIGYIGHSNCIHYWLYHNYQYLKT